MSLVPFFAAFLITLFATPLAIRFSKKRGIVGVDLHKERDLKVPEMGGTAVFFSLLVVLTAHYILGMDDLLSPILAIYMIGTLGVIDGLTRLSAVQKVTSFFVVGVFLSWGLGHRGDIPYVIVGLSFMAAVNFTNMLAGFNGLEIGTGAIASLGLAAAAFLAGAEESFIIASTMAGALFAFLYFNRYPARVFPGDVGTLIIGAALFSAILLGRLYIPGLLIFVPYIADATLKFQSAGVMTRESQKPTIVREGKLYVPEGSNQSIARLFLRRRAMTEQEVVTRVWATEAFFSALAIIYGVIA